MKISLNLANAIEDALQEIEQHPGDSMQDIFNEALTSWETGLKMNHRYEIQESAD